MFGIGTDSGKTHITCRFIKNLNLKFKNFFGIKPIISGFDAQSFQLSDNALLLSAMGVQNPSLGKTLSLSRYILSQPLSPDIASWEEGVDINFDEIITFCKEKINDLPSDVGIFIETAGGVCSPCSNAYTMIDISRALSEYNPCNILVINEYLGAISHAISALHTMKFDVIVFNRVSKHFMLSVKNHLPYEIYIMSEEDI